MTNILVDVSDFHRIQYFRESPQFTVRRGSYSPYWVHHADLIQISNKDQNAQGLVSLSVMGESGMYITSTTGSRGERFRKSIKRSLKASRIGRQIAAWSSHPNTLWMTYEVAYDRVMATTSQELRFPNGRCFPATSKDVRQEYSSWSGREGVDHILIAYHVLEILMKHTQLSSRSQRILEIGPGNGNLASLILNYFPNAQVTLVDLPETLQLSFLFLRSLFPHLEFVLPHEVNPENLVTANVVFLTPDQLDLLPDKSIDIAMNLHSFQEMLMPQIEEYFLLLQRVVCTNGCVLIVNRSEKMPNPEENSMDGVGCIRFEQYPWVTEWTDILHITSEFHLLVQSNDVVIRLVRT